MNFIKPVCTSGPSAFAAADKAFIRQWPDLHNLPRTQEAVGTETTIGQRNHLPVSGT